MKFATLAESIHTNIDMEHAYPVEDVLKEAHEEWVTASMKVTFIMLALILVAAIVALLTKKTIKPALKIVSFGLVALLATSALASIDAIQFERNSTRDLSATATTWAKERYGIDLRDYGSDKDISYTLRNLHSDDGYNPFANPYAQNDDTLTDPHATGDEPARIRFVDDRPGDENNGVIIVNADSGKEIERKA